MSQTNYERVDLAKAGGSGGFTADGASERRRYSIRWWIIPLSALLCSLQAVITLGMDNIHSMYPTSTLISVISFAVLFLTLLLVNPLLKLVRLIQPLSRAELTSMFAAMMVTAGIATFGLAGQIVPVIPAPWNSEWATQQSGWEQLHGTLNRNLYITDPAVIRVYREGLREIPPPSPPGEDAALEAWLTYYQQANRWGFALPFSEVLPQPPPDAEWALWADYYAQLDAQGIRPPLRARQLVAPAEDAGWDQWWPHYVTVFRNVPWSAWMAPLGFWMIFILGFYALFYCLTYTVLDYWSNREKLVFPLAKLPESLLPEDDTDQSWLPRILRSPGFWIAFSISFAIISYRAIHSAGWTGSLGNFPLGMGWQDFGALVEGTAFEGLSGSGNHLKGVMFMIIFTAVGIAFLLPLEISFSVWFYSLAASTLILVMTWMGYGRTHADFPTDWLWVQNAVTAQGGGGLLLFSAVSLYRCIKEFFIRGAGKSTEQKIKLSLPLIGLVVSIMVLTWWVWWNSVPLIWSAIFVLFLTLMTLGLMRIVAEGGIYWIQSNASFFHIWKNFGLGNAGLPASSLAPLLPIYGILFLDMKTFLAPNLANAGKLEQDLRVNRIRFHLNIVVSLLVTIVVAIGYALFLAYLRGAQRMAGWFYSSNPKLTFDTAQRAATEVPEVNYSLMGWTGFGLFWVALSMFLRKTLFWFPHPIGYVMVMNPLVKYMFFSFFIGWACKKIVVKYGGKATYDKLRDAFIGLILGELRAIFLWNALTLCFDYITIRGIDLNRYAA
jgi:hypothetical protein